MRHGWLIPWICILTGLNSTALAQNWPSKPIHAIVPFAAGSVVDIVPRIVFDQLSFQLHQPIVVENRSGAGSTIATAMVAKSVPDGYTMLVNSSAYTITPWVYSHLPYDAQRDLSAIIPLGVVPNVLVISPSKGIRTLGEFVDSARAKDGALTFASMGIGSETHMTAERFRFAAGYQAIHVPFKGAPEAITEVMEGLVDYCFCAIGTTLPYIRDGRLLALAVSTPKRSPVLPDVPTTLEAGFADSDYSPWLGVFAPAKTPHNVIQALHDEVLNAIQNSDVHAKFAKLGIESLIMNPSEFDAYVQREIALNGSLVKAIGLKAN